MRTRKLRSCLAEKMQCFIDLRRLSGTDYQSQSQLLGYFDRFLVEQRVTEPHITRDITDAYQRSLGHLCRRNQENHLCVVRQFCEYLSQTDSRCYIPEPLRRIRWEEARPHHIYRTTEVRAILAAASELSPPHSLRPETYRTLLGLLYSTGIRIGEALALNLEDFHSDQSSLWIAEGKFRKARWVPLSSSTSRALQQYVQRRQGISPWSLDSSLFLSQRSRRLHYSAVNRTFRYLLQQSGIPYHKHTGPRIHDLRHTFAVHRLLAWYRDGQDVNARLPWLATYMGHVDIHATQVYLRPTAELMEQVDRRFYQHYLQNVQSQGNPS
jgi:site-specific recombinase XerD